MPKRKTLDFVYFDAGGGHRTAAFALQSAIASRGYDWDVRLVNLQDVLDELDIFRKLTGIRLENLYNLMLAKGWTLGSTHLLTWIHGVIRLYHPAQVRLLAELWRSRNPDLVVSLIPNFNRALFEGLQRSLPGTPMVTVLTDLADYPPHFWIEKQTQFLICGTERACAQARAMGYHDEQIFRTSGMILRPDFYDRPQCDISEERNKLGLDAQTPTGIVLFGGHGSGAMLRIAESLGNSTSPLQLIMICGRNESLQARLAQLKTRNRIFVEGFTQNIPGYMRLADFFIGKAGPGSISEALKMGLPVVVERNAWTLPQERYNAQWVTEQGVGVVLKNFRGIDAAVRDLLTTEKLAQMKKRISAIENRAVFEVPVILEKILSATAG